MPQTFQVVVTGEGHDSVPKDASNLIVRSTALAFETRGVAMPPLKFTCHNSIPFGAGMGSSSAAIISGIAAGFALLGHTPDAASEEFLNVAAKLEGHPDNIAPCIAGGLRIGFSTPAGWRTTGVDVPDGLRCVVLVPSVGAVEGEGTKTEAARALLPPVIPRGDAVFNIGRAALLVHAFQTNQLHLIKHATEDALHQVCVCV